MEKATIIPIINKPIPTSSKIKPDNNTASIVVKIVAASPSVVPKTNLIILPTIGNPIKMIRSKRTISFPSHFLLCKKELFFFGCSS